MQELMKEEKTYGQSCKHFNIIIYNSSVVLTGNSPRYTTTTLEQSVNKIVHRMHVSLDRTASKA